MPCLSWCKTFFISIGLIFIDQFSKYIIRHGGGFYVCNGNVAFGIQMPPVLFWFFWALAVIVISALFKKSENKIHNLALVLILSGALSNIIDRLTLGCVVDFIDWKIWPAFNLADIFVVSGAIILLAKWRKIW